MEVKVVKTLADLEIPESGTVDLPRGDHSLRIPIKAITLEEQEEMQKDYKSPSPPRNFDKTGKKTADGKPGFYFDTDDPVYRQQIEDTQFAQTRAMAIAGLDIPLEGDDIDEKWNSIRKKLTVGDLVIIMEAILELSNVSSEEVEEAKKYLNQP